MSDIKAKRLKLEKIVKVVNDSLNELKLKCDHSGNVVYNYCGNSGNYDRTQDSYWMEWHCRDCDKRWITDQDDEGRAELNRLPNAVRSYVRFR